ncbi:hypothetical protein DRQ20_05135 [bacterium]|nr:MAG: hypothetical protein DRQ20_05135 [bacterium]
MNVELFKKIKEIEGIEGYGVVDAEEGNLIDRGGIIPGNIDELVAFFGSAGEVIANALNLSGMERIVGLGREKLLIVKKDKYYIGVIFENASPQELHKEIEEALKEEDLTGDPKVFALMKGKARQINLLLEEFSRGGNPEEWVNFVVSFIRENDKEGKFVRLIDVKDNKIIPKGALGLTQEEANTFMKQVADALIKRAVAALGKDEAKARVHNVIQKLGARK